MTPADVKAAFPNDPNIQAMSDAELQVYIDVAGCLIDESVFCDATCGARALLLMAAHLATLGARGWTGGAAGAITSEKAGDLARSYANGAGIDDENELGLTSYGQMLAMLRRTLVRTPFVV